MFNRTDLKYTIKSKHGKIDDFDVELDFCNEFYALYRKANYHHTSINQLIFCRQSNTRFNQQKITTIPKDEKIFL